MEDPITLIRSIAVVTGKCFVWTHYYDKHHYPGPARELRSDPRYPGVDLYALTYSDMDYGRFWGGNRPVSVWLRRDDIIESFRAAGLTRVEVIDDTPDHPNGACLTFCATREQAGNIRPR